MTLGQAGDRHWAGSGGEREQALSGRRAGGGRKWRNDTIIARRDGQRGATRLPERLGAKNTPPPRSDCMLRSAPFRAGGQAWITRCVPPYAWKNRSRATAAVDMQGCLLTAWWAAFACARHRRVPSSQPPVLIRHHTTWLTAEERRAAGRHGISLSPLATSSFGHYVCTGLSFSSSPPIPP